LGNFFDVNSANFANFLKNLNFFQIFVFQEFEEKNPNSGFYFILFYLTHFRDCSNFQLKRPQPTHNLIFPSHYALSGDTIIFHNLTSNFLLCKHQIVRE
jgi:hypothetical protein